MNNLQLREQEEIQRSAKDAANQRLEAEIDRYLNATKNSIHPWEYAHYFMGNIVGKDVLDFGCGSGENTLILAAKGADVTGMDISPELLELAEKRLAQHDYRATLVTGSCHEAPFPNESFDVIFGAAILHHLDLDLARREVYRLLKPGGLAVFCEPLRDSSVYAFLRGLIPYSQHEVSPDEKPLTSRQIRKFCHSLQIEEFRRYELPLTYQLRWFRFSNIALRLLPPLRHFATSVMFAARKPIG